MIKDKSIYTFLEKKLFLFLLIAILSTSGVLAQKVSGEEVEVEKDTTGHVHSPKLAMYMSAVVPGSGQIYNKKYWKVPVIYVLGGAAVYSTIYNSDQYHVFKNAFNAKSADATYELEGYEGYSKEQLKSIKDQYRRYRDLSVIGLGLLYVLNVVDAAVDGYLFDYDVSDDLSLRVEPTLLPYVSQPMPQSVMAKQWQTQNQFGLKCTIKF